VHSHALDLRLFSGADKKPAHRHQLAVEEADQEIPARVEVGPAYVAKVVLPRPAPAVRACVLERGVMQMPHGIRILVTERAQLEPPLIFLPRAGQGDTSQAF